MSLMTQSLRRLADTRGGFDARPSSRTAERESGQPRDRRPSPPGTAAASERIATATLPAEVVPEHRPAAPDELIPPVREANRSPAIRPRRAHPRYCPLEVPPAAARLRDAIFADLGRPDEGKPFNKVVLIAGIQATGDANSAVASLARACVGLVGGDVLVVDASSAATAELGEAVCEVHGFTSLVDGTRRLPDVVAPTPTPGLSLVRAGLAKGDAQAVDESAIEQLARDCREGFACTLISGGDWETSYLPLIARAADAFYLVIRTNRTDRDTAKRAVKFFDRSGIHVRGCLLTGTTP